MSEQSPYRHEATNEAVKRGSNSNVWKYLLTGLITAMFTFVITVAILLAVYFSLGPTARTTDSFSIDLKNADAETIEAADKLKTIYKHIYNDYYRELSDAEMLEAMSAGLAYSMDSPYTMYLTAEENKIITDSMSGEYSGVGAIVSMREDGRIEISELMKDGPAVEVGLQIGDIFISVDGEDVTALSDITALTALVKGPEGSEVELEIFRPSEGTTLTFKPVRRKIESANISYRMLDDYIGYISVMSFSNGIADQFTEAVDDLQRQGAKSIIFDMRNNSGGLAHEVTKMLDYILPEQTLATVKGRSRGLPYTEYWESSASMGVPEDMQFAVLTNQYTASAAELFSGCLQDFNKAVVIGTQTFGKGSGTITYQLNDGSALAVTNFLYYLPNGESIEGDGLHPDIEIELSEEAKVKPVSLLTLDEDTQLAAAIEQLQQD